MEELRTGSISADSFSVLDRMGTCGRCGAPVLESTESVVQSIVEHYGTDTYEDELYELIEKWPFSNDYSEDGSFCGYCEYQMSKDD